MEDRNERGQFTKGHKGYASPGRPKREVEISFLELVKEVVDEGKQRKVIKAMLDKAIAGDINAAKFIWEYLGGKALQPIDLTTAGEKITFSALDEMTNAQRNEYFARLSIALSGSGGSIDLASTASEKE